MIILGVDLGSKATGLALVVDGVPDAFHHFPVGIDGAGLRMGIEAFLWETTAGLPPALIATEIPFFCQGKARGGPVIAHLTGVLEEIARTWGVPFKQVAISTWKEQLTGRGNATHKQYRDAVEAMFGLAGLTFDEAAAIGIALAAEGDGKGVYDD